MPWKKKPESVHVMLAIGPCVNILHDAPPGVSNVFIGLRFGLFFATRGDEHIDEKQDATQEVREVGRATYFRSGVPLVPDYAFVSPLRDATGMSVYGIGLRAVSFGMHPAGGLFRFGFSGGLDITYAFIETRRAGYAETHFFQPGLDIRGDVELDWDGPFFVSAGWVSIFHLPQSFEGRTEGPFLWHIGQAFLLGNFRIGDRGPSSAAP